MLELAEDHVAQAVVRGPGEAVETVRVRSGGRRRKRRRETGRRKKKRGAPASADLWAP